jgi:hypothetical protein
VLGGGLSILLAGALLIGQVKLCQLAMSTQLLESNTCLRKLHKAPHLR